MPSIGATVLDNSLTALKNAARYLYICSAEPATFTQASTTYALGVKDFGVGGVFPGAIADGINGRKLTTAAITDGNATGNGVANYWAITDSSNLLVTGALKTSQSVSAGNEFSLDALDVLLRTS